MIPEIPSMTLPQLWASVVAMAAPAIVALVSRSNWPSWARTLTQIVTSLVVATGTMAIAGQLHISDPHSWQAWATLLLLVIVVTETSFRLIWRPTGAATALEAVGSPTPARGDTEEAQDTGQEESGSVIPDVTLARHSADDPGMIEPTDDTASTDSGSGSVAVARHAQE